MPTAAIRAEAAMPTTAPAEAVMPPPPPRAP